MMRSRKISRMSTIIWKLQPKGSARGYPNLQPWHRAKNFMYLPEKLNPSNNSHHDIQSLLERHFGRGTYRITFYGDEIFRTKKRKILI